MAPGRTARAGGFGDITFFTSSSVPCTTSAQTRPPALTSRKCKLAPRARASPQADGSVCAMSNTLTAETNSATPIAGWNWAWPWRPPEKAPICSGELVCTKTPNDAKPLPAAPVHQLCAPVILRRVKKQPCPLSLYLSADAGSHPTWPGGGPHDRASSSLTRPRSTSRPWSSSSLPRSSPEALLRPPSRLAAFFCPLFALRPAAWPPHLPSSPLTVQDPTARNREMQPS